MLIFQWYVEMKDENSRYQFSFRSISNILYMQNVFKNTTWQNNINGNCLTLQHNESYNILILPHLT